MKILVWRPRRAVARANVCVFARAQKWRGGAQITWCEAQVKNENNERHTMREFLELYLDMRMCVLFYFSTRKNIRRIENGYYLN